MPQTVQPPLTALLINGVQRFASCWQVKRQDGVTFRFTDHDVPLSFDDEHPQGVVGSPVVSNGGGYPAATTLLNIGGMTVASTFIVGEQIRFAGHATPYTVKAATAANGGGIGTITIQPPLQASVANSEVVQQITSVFLPLNSFNASARQRLPNLRTRNLDLVGVLDSDVITHADLRAGLYKECKFTEFLVDWRFPHEGYINRASYWLSSSKFTGEIWAATVEGVARYLQQTIGGRYTRSCSTTFGSAKCGLSVGSYTTSGSVVAITSQRLTFTTTLTDPNAFYSSGNLTWTSGLNAGTSVEIKEYFATGGSITLELRTKAAITIGDTFDAIQGCDHLYETCLNTFNNIENFRGFPFIAGTDKTLTTPNQR